MAPKNKFTKDEMVLAGVRVVKKLGFEKLTAKTMANELKTSTQPIFTCFSTMDALKNEVRLAAKDIYDEYVNEGLKEKIPFFGFGMQYIRFAEKEPNLYRMLFLSPIDENENSDWDSVKHSQNIVRPTLEKIYRISPADADRYFRDLWLVVHSLATLIVTGRYNYSEEETKQILTEFSVSICKAIKEIPGFTAGTFNRDEVFQSLIGE